MQDPQFLDPANRELAEALEGLQLAPTQTAQRDIWYRAGMEAGRKRTRAWQAAAAIMLLATGAMGLHGRPMPGPVIERVVYLPGEHTPPMNTMYSGDASLSVSSANLRLRNAILQDGLDALPISEGAIEEAPLQPGMSLPVRGKDSI